MSPAGQLLEDLATARRHGLDFAQAWPTAVAHAIAASPPDERADWREALAATRDAWQAAWDRAPASSPEFALRAVADDPDREPISDERTCGYCGQPMPPMRGTLAKWCSDRCRRRVETERRRMGRLAIAA